MTNSEHTLISFGKNRKPNQPEHFCAWSHKGPYHLVFQWCLSLEPCDVQLNNQREFSFQVWSRVVAIVSHSLRWPIIVLIFFKIGNNNNTVLQAMEYGRNFDIFPFKILISSRKLKRGRTKPRPRQHETNTGAFNAIP